MSSITVNSDTALQSFLGTVRELYQQHRFLRVSIKTGKDRTLNQNALIHTWYEQIARELREDDASGWRSYCKLTLGVPILRAEDEEFRTAYDAVIKPLHYETKLLAMQHWPVSSLMSVQQLSKYAEAIQVDFAKRGVVLEAA